MSNIENTYNKSGELHLYFLRHFHFELLRLEAFLEFFDDEGLISDKKLSPKVILKKLENAKLKLVVKFFIKSQGLKLKDLF